MFINQYNHKTNYLAQQLIDFIADDISSKIEIENQCKMLCVFERPGVAAAVLYGQESPGWISLSKLVIFLGKYAETSIFW